MKYKNYLGNKKTTLSVSISRSIKEYLERYQKDIFKNTKDKRLKNISVFINNILEICVRFFSAGYNLDELKTINNAPKKEITNFFDDLLVKVNPHQFEESIELDKYRPVGKLILNSYLTYRNFALGTLKLNSFTNEDAIKILKLFEKFLIQNKLTERFDVYSQGNNIIMEYRGFYTNIHFIYSEGIVGLMGYFGLKLINFYYEDKFIQFTFKITPLFKNKETLIKQRKALSYQNINKLISVDQMLKDKKFHLWVALSQNENSILSFKDYDFGKKTILELLTNLENNANIDKLTSNSSYIRKVLTLFSFLNWITIIDMKTL
ncbi:MAG: hypothetical protein ACFFEY_11675, partial [Candidatus Thorarchaeota archaeon]